MLKASFWFVKSFIYIWKIYERGMRFLDLLKDAWEFNINWIGICIEYVHVDMSKASCVFIRGFICIGEKLHVYLSIAEFGWPCLHLCLFACFSAASWRPHHGSSHRTLNHE